MLRGTDRRTVFSDYEDNRRFVEILRRVKRESTFQLFAHFLDVLRYICQNPVKTGLCEKPFEYPWLGCSGITEEDALLDSFGTPSDLNGDALLGYVSGQGETEHPDDNGTKRLTDHVAIERLRITCGCGHAQDIGGWTAEKRDAAIRKALRTGVSIRQLSRLTGISKAIIERVAKK